MTPKDPRASLDVGDAKINLHKIQKISKGTPFRSKTFAKVFQNNITVNYNTKPPRKWEVLGEISGKN